MKTFALFIMFFFTFLPTVMADDVLNSLERAKRLYEQGNYSQAVSELQFTAGLIQDRQMDHYKIILPEPPSGWTGDKAQVSRGTGLGVGGGITVSRSYHRSDGQSVTVEGVTDSPLVAGLAMILGNPLLMGNNRLVMVNGEKAIEEWDQNSGSGKLQIIIHNRMLVTISGSHLKLKDVLYDFGRKIDFKSIRKMLQE